MTKPIKINSIEELKKLSKNGDDFFIFLYGGLRSSKHIEYDEEMFYVLNEIDGSEQELTEKQLYTESNIGKALDRGALFKHP